MDAIREKKIRVKDCNAWLAGYGETAAPLLSSKTVTDVVADREKATHELEKLRGNRQRTANMFVYTVSFTPKSSRTSEAIASEFGRLAALDEVVAVEIESDAPDDDPRNSIDFRTWEDQDR